MAVELIERAIASNGKSAVYYNSLGAARRSLGQLDEAVACFRRAIACRPHYAEAHYNLGQVQVLGEHLVEAATAFETAARLAPQLVDAQNELGNVLQRMQRYEEAEAVYRRALAIEPHKAALHHNLGKLLLAQQRLVEAEAELREATRLAPSNRAMLLSLGAVYVAQRRWEEARPCYEAILEHEPERFDAWMNLGTALDASGAQDQAAEAFERAVRLRDDSAEAHANLAAMLEVEGKTDQAIEHYRQACRLKPDDAMRIREALVLPPVYTSAADVIAHRERLTESVDQLLADGVRVDPLAAANPPCFFLAYQGFNDRALLERIARLYRVDEGSAPQANAGPHRAGGRIRIGFLSRFLHNHTIGLFTSGLIAGLPRDRFEVFTLAPARHDDQISRFLRQNADACVELNTDPRRARRQVEETDVDVLFYPEIGMDPLAYSLAHCRIAPVQCVSWGHPTTTGLPTIDYFVSSEAIETAESESHYREQLVRLKRLPTHYQRPPKPTARRRADFGLPDDRPLYICPQNLFKFHPDFDAILSAILARDPQGLLVLIEGHHRPWTDRLRRRLADSLGEAMGRVVFLPRQPLLSFLALLSEADVMLDPLHFGGGNTSYQALSQGLPIVTLPSPLMRGRVTLGLYRQLECVECVVDSAEAYVEKAVRLARDRDYRRWVVQQLQGRDEAVFEDPKVIDEFAAFFMRAAHDQRATSTAGEQEVIDASRCDNHVRSQEATR